MAIKAPLYSSQGVKLSDTVLPDAIFGVAVNEPLIAQALRSYTSRQRQNTKKVKTRGEISLTTQKVWRQKGTGRARHGSRRAPIFVGGGVAHGPTGQENYHLRVSKVMRRAALHSALSLHAQNHSITLVDGLDTLGGKTKLMQSLIHKLIKSAKAPAKILLILDSSKDPTIKSVKNLEGINPTQVRRLNLFEVMNHQELIFTKKALDLLT